jgi:hypothetical protein
LGTLWELWELERNIEATCWEQRENEKNPPSNPHPPKPKLLKKNQGTLSACFSLPNGCMYIWFLKLLVTIFGLG